MKKQVKQIIATALACTMAVSVQGIAFASSAAALDPSMASNTAPVNGTVIEGSNSVEGITYNVILPTKIPFVVDTYEMKGMGAQIYSPTFPIVNHSDVKVQVDVSTLAAAGDAEVVFVDKPDHVGLTTLDDNHAAFMEVLIPDSINVAAGSTVTTPAANMVTADYTTPADATRTVDRSFTNEKAHSFSFKLAERLNDTDDTYDVTNAAAFMFIGSVNASSDWKAGDIKATATFSFKGLNDDYAASLPTDSSKNINLIEYQTFETSAAGGSGTGTLVVKNPSTDSNETRELVSVILKDTGDEWPVDEMWTYAKSTATLTMKKDIFNGELAGTYHLMLNFDSGYPTEVVMTVPEQTTTP